MVEIRLIIVEALLLLCKSRLGRDTLRKHYTYFILLEWHEKETDEQVKSYIMSVTRRVAADDEDVDEDE